MRKIVKVILRTLDFKVPEKGFIVTSTLNEYLCDANTNDVFQKWKIIELLKKFHILQILWLDSYCVVHSW